MEWKTRYKVLCMLEVLLNLYYQRNISERVLVLKARDIVSHYYSPAIASRVTEILTRKLGAEMVGDILGEIDEILARAQL